MLRTTRIPLLRPLRPPSSRFFTQNHPLLLIRPAPRPQLPYLSQPLRKNDTNRWLTTETKTYVRQQTWIAVKWTAVGWSMIFLASIAWYGWQSELIEREHPSPPEWSYFTKSAFRAGYARSDPEFNGMGMVDWGSVATEFRRCLVRLESKDGRGLKTLAESEEKVSGIGMKSLDLSEKSLAWRAGYFHVVMQCGRAAEILDGMVRDKTRKLVFPRDVMIGPSNPNPRPLLPGMDAAPLEENCDRPFATPETFYLRILTSIGFTTKQRLDAALAYANWLDYKGEASEEVYRLAVDIAAEPLPATELFDKSGALSEAGKATASSNLLRASTALASNLARAGNVASALPIYLSVLQARRLAPIEPTPQSTPRPSLFRMIIRSSEYPLDRVTGDEPLLRPDHIDCAEAELMLYIGEILFGSKAADGAAWTRQAVETARKGVAEKSLPVAQKKQCAECLQAGLTNWSTMTRKLAKLESKGGWFSKPSHRWEEEAQMVEALRQEVLREGVAEQFTGKAPGSLFIG